MGLWNLPISICPTPAPRYARRMTHAAFPDLRLRRTRSTGWSRAMVRETTLSPSNLIWPLFVCDGSGTEEPLSLIHI